MLGEIRKMYNPETAYKAFIETRKEDRAVFEVKQQKLSEGLSLFQVLEDEKVKESFVAASMTDKDVEKWQAALNGSKAEKPKRKKK